MAAKKKTFKNPANNYFDDEPEIIAPVKEEAAPTEPAEPTEAKAKSSSRKPATKQEQSKEKAAETKSRRVNILLKPSIKNNMDKLAAIDRTSLNDLINKVLEDYTQGRTTDIERYNSFYGE